MFAAEHEEGHFTRYPIDHGISLLLHSGPPPPSMQSGGGPECRSREEIEWYVW